ncbi:Zinc finger SWIM domain-containing protein 6 [Orchesella cincta]|uniref:Zinc finger SWIM domain-containing protein 6 n=1 Tax=Orchesella cincta TaxID=48709 RepID=A0A1D2MNP9_ORCCI|nr:Zinc finger SWIM domain-containing protein 6 [Orchesella cincta]
MRVEVFKHANHENLVSVSFNIALHVVKSTKYTVHRRRWEMVRWVVSCGVEIGVAKLFYLVRNWGEYFSPVEAVGTVASNILTWVVGGTGSNANSTNVIPGPSKLNNHDKRLMEELANAARNLAIQCAKNDPQNCALNTLTLCENDPMAFETSYQIVLESASKEFLTPQQIFTIARTPTRWYQRSTGRATCPTSCQRQCPGRRTRVCTTRAAAPCKAPPPASSLSPPTSELESLIPLLIRNIKCATVLTEILRRSITIMTSYENAYQKEKHGNKKLKQRVYEKLSLLIEGTIDSYITTTHSRLVHISPRHYSDFIEFLTKARENFLLAPNGNERFKHLVESMKCTYKGKKKLLFLLTERFG